MQAFPLHQLDVIGFTEVPSLEPAMPRVLSPIFAVRDSTMVLFPPYCLDGAMLFQPHVSDHAEFDDLLAGEEVSRIQPQAAIAGHELWLDDEGAPHYDSAAVTAKRLQEIYTRRLALGEAAWARGDFESARLNATVAYAADTRKLDPLILCAALEVHLGKLDELELTADLAAQIMSRAEFMRSARSKYN